MPDGDGRTSPDAWRWRIAGAAGLLLLVAYHLWWLLRMRNGYSVDTDEAGYVSIALNDLAGLRAGGLGGLWDAFQQQTPNAPLVPLLAVPALAVHKAILPVYAVELGALVVLALATFGLARELAGPRWGALAALTVAALPGVLGYTREFSFALPCAAAFTVSAWALVRSAQLTRLPWALAWGAAAGLSVLARTMAIGFVPGVLAAALLVAATAPAGLRRRAFAHLAAGAGAGVLVAATWYWRNLPYVLDYLRGFGYGAQANEYGTHHSVLSSEWWLAEPRLAVGQLVFVPLVVVAAAVLLAALPAAWRALAAPDRGATLARALRAPATPLLLLLVEGYLALSSTANNGSAFALPLLPLACVLLVAVAARLPHRSLRAAAAGGLALVAGLQLLSFAQIGAFDEIFRAEVPLLGSQPITDPRAPAVAAVALTPNALRFGPADRGWIEASGRLGYLANRHANAEGFLPIVAFASRDRLLNTNTVTLAGLLSSGLVFPMAQLTTAEGDTAAAYRAFLADPLHGQPNVLVTSDGEANDFEPVVTQARAESAARSLGFEPFASVRQPNGETARLWWLARGPAIPAPPATADASRSSRP